MTRLDIERIRRTLDSIYAEAENLKQLIKPYDRALTSVGVTPIEQMGLSEKVTIAEFILSIRGEDATSQKTVS